MYGNVSSINLPPLQDIIFVLLYLLDIAKHLYE